MLGLGAGELYCRSLLANQHFRNEQFSSELGWSLIPGSGDIGEHGWRLPYYPQAKAPGRFRIVCLGDSTTFGYHCTWQESWPNQLETLLNADAAWSNTHGTTEVLNLGVPAYGPDQALIALQKYGLSYKPNVVIFHLCVNDFADVSFDYQWLKAEGVTRYKPFYRLQEGRLVVGRDHALLPTDADGNPYEPKPPPSPFSAFLTVLRNRIQSQIYDKPMTAEDRQKVFDHWSHYLWPIREDHQAEYKTARPLVWALIREMARVSREAGAVFLVTLSPTLMLALEDKYPWRVAGFMQEFTDDAKAAGVAAVNCVPQYFADGGNERFRLTGADTAHLNAEGNAFIARLTQRWIHDEYATAAQRPKR
jgi:lysophospholipase L1-like esterase